MGSEIVAITMETAFDHLDAPIERVAGAEIPMPYAVNLERQALPSVCMVAFLFILHVHDLEVHLGVLVLTCDACNDILDAFVTFSKFVVKMVIGIQCVS